MRNEERPERGVDRWMRRAAYAAAPVAAAGSIAAFLQTRKLVPGAQRAIAEIGAAARKTGAAADGFRAVADKVHGDTLGKVAAAAERVHTVADQVGRSRFIPRARNPGDLAKGLAGSPQFSGNTNTGFLTRLRDKVLGAPGPGTRAFSARSVEVLLSGGYVNTEQGVLREKGVGGHLKRHAGAYIGAVAGTKVRVLGPLFGGVVGAAVDGRRRNWNVADTKNADLSPVSEGRTKEEAHRLGLNRIGAAGLAVTAGMFVTPKQLRRAGRVVGGAAYHTGMAGRRVVDKVRGMWPKAPRAFTPFAGRTVDVRSTNLAAESAKRLLSSRERLMLFACSPEENLYLRDRLLKARAQGLKKHLRVFHFGGREQWKNARDNTYANPAAAAMGTQKVYYRKDKEGNPIIEEATLRHAQVGRYVWNQAARAERPLRRGYGMVRDVKDVVAGNPRRTDSRGRPRPREWEKAWFKRTLGIAGAAAAGMGGLAYLKHFPHQGPGLPSRVKVPFTKGKYSVPVGEVMPKVAREARAPSRDAILGKVDAVKDAINRHVPDFFPRPHLAARLREILLDYTSGDWDVRDARGRSARVFAGGSNPRDRRPKYWWETARNQRIMAAVGIAGAASAAFAGGRMTKDRSLKSLSPFRNPFRAAPGWDGNVVRNTPPPIRRRPFGDAPVPVHMGARSFREVLLDYATAEP